MKKSILFLLITCLIVIGCKKGREEKTGTPGMKKTTEIVIPRDVRKEWKAVKVQLTDKEKNEQKIFEIEIGKEMKLGDTGLSVEVLHFAPDFKMAPGEITSVSSEPKNPAAQVVIKEDGKEPLKVWLFYNYPDVHAFVHPRYQLALVGFVKAEK